MMARVRRVGRWRGRFYRAAAAAQSLCAWITLWRRMNWHEKMFVLFVLEEMETDRKFCRDVIAGLRIAWLYSERRR